jgi:hypothetical protein
MTKVLEWIVSQLQLLVQLVELLVTKVGVGEIEKKLF